MLLSGKNVVIFGGGGAIGSTVARTMAREGANVFLGARSKGKLDCAADSIRMAGGTAEIFIVDVLDEQSTTQHIAQLAQQAGGIDVVVNATGFMHEQGKRIEALSLAEFMSGITPFLSAQFNISKAVTPYMGGERAGSIITVVAPAAPMAMPGHLGHIVGCAGTEAFIKALASELGPQNIRVLGVRSHAIVDAIQAGLLHRGNIHHKSSVNGVNRGTMAGWRRTKHYAQTSAHSVTNRRSYNISGIRSCQCNDCYGGECNKWRHRQLM